ncbi:hypothetical protein [Conexibacter sp. CPCC 206217]|uniref:hypothetical protein n=1 Tax=Conexibacter sp. CPCC 206217 TaxID=3064574 RepID=UPI002724B58C|nr:hypothetical protein [Conexibacter sp. CPCC 206217]MDO8211288.1 hypothetical protein [Conexibacter sp. CPCC 206217]
MALRVRVRVPALALATVSALVLAGCGGGGDDFGATIPHGTTATTPGAPRRWSPPALRLERGRGREIGAEARLEYAASGPALPTGFVPGGVPVGTRSGPCVVPEPTDAQRTQIQTTAERQTPDGSVVPIDDDHILLADCGDEGVWAFVAWTEGTAEGRQTVWIDEFRYDGGDHWTGTARGVQPGCRMPRAAAAAWQIDVTECPPPPTPPPPTPTIPGPTPQIPSPRPDQLPAPGTSRA